MKFNIITDSCCILNHQAISQTHAYPPCKLLIKLKLLMGLDMFYKNKKCGLQKNFHRVTVACYFLLWRSMCIFCPSCPPFCSSTTTWASRILPILSSNKNSLQTTAIYFLFFQAGNSTICRCNAGKPHVSISTKNFVRQGEKRGNNQKPRSTKLPAALLSKTMKKSDTGCVFVSAKLPNLMSSQ